jgi:hypothetical protein
LLDALNLLLKVSPPELPLTVPLRPQLRRPLTGRMLMTNVVEPPAGEDKPEIVRVVSPVIPSRRGLFLFAITKVKLWAGAVKAYPAW